MTIWRCSRWQAARALVMGLVLAFAGCATTSFYRPTEQLVADVQGFPAARYSVPPEAPRGDVKLISRGVVSVRARESGATGRALQVGLVAANDNDVGPWTIDVRQQRLFLPGYADRAPALASTTPVLTVRPGRSALLELFFRLPAGVDDSSALPAFELLWKVGTPTRVVAERTPFRRETIDSSGYPYGVEPSVSVGLGFGYGYGYGFARPYGYWGYDPFYPSYFYYRRPYAPYPPPVIHYRAVPRRVSVVPGRVAPVPPAPPVPAQPNRSAPVR